MTFPDDPIQDLVFSLAAKHQEQSRRRQRNPTSRTPKLDPKLSKTQERGLQYEAIALEYLLKQGLTLLKRNLKSVHGEIDLVMQEANTLVFIEVRYRRSKRYGDAIASISKQKQQRIRHTASQFLPMISHEIFNNKTPPCRFDIVGIDGPENDIIWLQNAFS